MAHIFVSVFVLIALWELGNGQDLPDIAKVILPDIKRVGENGKLNCTVTRVNDNTNVYWIRRRDRLRISKDEKIELDERLNNIVSFGDRKYEVIRHEDSMDQFTYTLHIRKLALDDAGFYQCKLMVTGLPQEHVREKDGKMVVLLPPSIRQAGTTQSITVIEDDSVELVCNADGYPTPNITWVRTNREPLPPPYNRISYKGNRMMIPTANRTAQGVYRCLADNNVRPFASHYATLNVQFMPHARPVQTTYGQAQGRQFDVVLECIIEGFPEPDLTWYKLGDDGIGQKQIIDDDEHNINILLSHGLNLGLSEYWFQLVVINVQGNDYGFYICEGKNARGTGTAKIHLYETSECQGANCPAEGGFIGAASSIQHSLTFIALTLTSLLFL